MSKRSSAPHTILPPLNPPRASVPQFGAGQATTAADSGAGNSPSIHRDIAASLAFSPEPTVTQSSGSGSSHEYQQKLQRQQLLHRRGNVDMASAEPIDIVAEVPSAPAASQPPCINAPRFQTVRQLLSAIAPSTPGPTMRMLSTAAQHIADFWQVSLDDLRVEALMHLGLPFRVYLKECRGESTGKPRFQDSTVRAYCYHANLLREKAEQLGLTSPPQELLDRWEPVLRSASRHPHLTFASIVGYAVRCGCSPADFSLEHLRDWVQLMYRERRSLQYVRRILGNFRQCMRKLGFRQRLWEIWEWLPEYGVPFSSLPESFRLQMERVAGWKQNRYSPGRPRGSRHRPVSSEKLRKFVCRVYGFCTRIQGCSQMTNLVELVTPENINGFLEFYLNQRHRKTQPLISDLGLLRAVMEHFPEFKKHDFSWLQGIIDGLEEDDAEEAARPERKARNSISYRQLEQIADQIAQDRESQSSLTPLQAAFLMHDEFLMRFWPALPWRQKNIRECRIGSNGNVFKAELPLNVAIKKPDWVVDELRVNPRAQFWQIRFDKHETKMGNAVHMILPFDLIAPLENYLAHAREVIRPTSDPGTLFFHRKRKPFTLKQLTQHIEELTFRCTGIPVNPHLLRDIFAYNWLDEHPEDYLSLMTILWHKDLKTTLRIYGRNFNESNGAYRIDEWLRQRHAEAGDVFSRMKAAARSRVTREGARQQILTHIDKLERAPAGSEFARCYQALVAGMAEHIASFVEFLPELSRRLQG